MIAIENTRLLRELRERTDDLSESLQQHCHRRRAEGDQRLEFDLKSVLVTPHGSVKALCGASLGIITLRDGDVMRLQAESAVPRPSSTS